MCEGGRSCVRGGGQVREEAVMCETGRSCVRVCKRGRSCVEWQWSWALHRWRLGITRRQRLDRGRSEITGFVDQKRPKNLFPLQN